MVHLETVPLVAAEVHPTFLKHDGCFTLLEGTVAVVDTRVRILVRVLHSADSTGAIFTLTPYWPVHGRCSQDGDLTPSFRFVVGLFDIFPRSAHVLGPS